MSYILFIFIIYFVSQVYFKIEFINSRNKSEKIAAVVVEYKKEKGPRRSDFTKLHYPYVKIDLENEAFTIKRLRYASNWERPFKIGQKIYVFYHQNDLLYWNAFDHGINKYLPNQWNFIKK